MTTQFNLADLEALLARTPAALDSLLRDLPESWVRSNEGGSTWNAYDIVGHLSSGERTDWMPRLRRILEHGESLPFEPFDRLAQFKNGATLTLEQRLDEFAQLRRRNLAELAALQLQPRQLSLTGTHPALGRVTVAQLLSTWAMHDLTHLHQLTRVLAYQYREDVGPWSAFLGVMQCNGHSS